MGGSGHGESIPGDEAAWGGADAEIGAAMVAPTRYTGRGRDREREREKHGEEGRYRGGEERDEAGGVAWSRSGAWLRRKRKEARRS